MSAAIAMNTSLLSNVTLWTSLCSLSSRLSSSFFAASMRMTSSRRIEVGQFMLYSRVLKSIRVPIGSNARRASAHWFSMNGISEQDVDAEPPHRQGS